MPIGFACDGCGKIYRVPPSAAGKRAKCPACGSVTVVPTLPAVDPYGDHAPREQIIARLPTGPVAVPRVSTASKPAVFEVAPPIRPAHPASTFPVPVVRAVAATTMTEPARAAVAAPTPAEPAAAIYLSHSAGWFYPFWHVLAGLLLIAAAAAWWARRWPKLWYSALGAFPSLAVLFLLAGAVAIRSRTIRAGGARRLGRKDLLLLAAQIPLAVVLPVSTAALGKRLRHADHQEAIFQQVSDLFFRSLAVAMMSVLIVIVGYWSGDCPLNHRPNQDGNVSNPLAVERQIQTAPGAPRAAVTIPADIPDTPSRITGPVISPESNGVR